MTAIETLRTPPRDDAPSFRREPAPPPLSPGNSFVRLVTAKTIASVHHVKAAEVAAQLWPSDKVVGMITRAASAPAMTSVAGWAAELVHKVVADALEALGPASAGAQVLKQSLVLNWDGNGIISVPALVATFGNAGFVAEGQPIPVHQLHVGPALMYPHKLAALAALTREMVDSSNAEALVGDTLMRAAGRMLDEVLVDANPETPQRPAGLRLGVAALTASSAADPRIAFSENVAALIDAMSPVGGNGPYIIIASPGRAAQMNLYQFRETGIQVLGSNACINDMLGICPAALATALSPNPEVESAIAGTLVMDDVTPSLPGVAGQTEKSLWQTDSLAIKMRWPVSWVLRDPRGFAWMTPTW